MKKLFSKTFSIVLVVSFVLSFGMIAGAADNGSADATKLFTITQSTSYNIVTVDVAINGAFKNFGGANLRFSFDPNVLEPIDAGSGADMAKTTDGDTVQNISGIYEKGLVENNNSVYTVGFASAYGVNNTSAKRSFLHVAFRVKKTDATSTTVKVFCKEFITYDDVDNDISTSDDLSAMRLAATLSVSTFVLPPVTVANAGSGVLISWTESGSAASAYRIYRKLSTDSSWSVLTTVKSPITSYIDKTAAAGKIYIYTLRAYTAAGKATGYNTAGYTVKRLKQPAITSIYNSVSGIQLNWGAVTGASGYQLFRREPSSGWTNLGKIGQTAYTDKSAKSGTTYIYILRAYSGSFVSTYCSEGSIEYLSTPRVKVSNAEKGVQISWGAVAGADGYIVYYMSSKGWKQLIKTTGTGTFTVDSAVGSGTKYTYTVRAYAGSYRSNFTSGSSVVYYATPKMTSLSNVVGGVQLKWGKVGSATGYTIYRKALGDSSWSRIATTSGATYFKDQTAKSGVTYIYTLRATGKYGSSYYAVAGWTIKCLSAPTIKSAKKVAGGITMTYGAVSGAESYQIYRKVGSGGWAALATVTGGSTSYTDTNVVAGTTYTYTARAISGGYRSDFTSGLSCKY